MSTMTKNETAQQAYDRNFNEAVRLLGKLIALPKSEKPHWGHVGDMAECVSSLRQAAHWAGVEKSED